MHIHILYEHRYRYRYTLSINVMAILEIISKCIDRGRSLNERISKDEYNSKCVNT